MQFKPIESQEKLKIPLEMASRGCINVGSRKSQLALIQTNLVIGRLKLFYENNPDILENLSPNTKGELNFNIKSMTTTGDKILDKPLPEIGAKSLFTRELELELLQGGVDFVVHSLKDLPTTLPEGCVIGAILERDSPEDAIVLKKALRAQVDPFDLLLGRANSGISGKVKIGTSSQRRISMIRRVNPNLECIDIRGNLNTRLAKLDNDESEYSAIILAKAGLDRMAWSDRVSSLLIPKQGRDSFDWSYAVGQGAIAVECRSNDQFTLELLQPIADIKTTFEAIAERSLMKELKGGCSVPLGVRSTWTEVNNGKQVLKLSSIVLSIDGKRVVEADGNADLLWDSPEVTGEPEKQIHECLTTGIVLSDSTLAKQNLKHDVLESVNLGIKVANKMIDSGCLSLLNRDNI